MIAQRVNGTYLEPSIQFSHFLGVFPFSYPNALFHLFCFRLDIFPDSDEGVYGGFECAYKWFRIECYELYMIKIGEIIDK